MSHRIQKGTDMPTITGKSSSETLRGTDESDRIIPNGGEDIIYGGGGDD